MFNLDNMNLQDLKVIKSVFDGTIKIVRTNTPKTGDSMKEKKHYESTDKARAKYDAENTKKIVLKLNIKTDADILDALEASGNKQGYIKELIGKDLKRKRPK